MPKFELGQEVLVCGKTAGVVTQRQQLYGPRWYYSVRFHNTGQLAISVIEEHMSENGRVKL